MVADAAASAAVRGRAVTCCGLSCTFQTSGAPIPALAPVDVVFDAGRTTAIVGPSGCGKSTLLRLIAGLETATTGTIHIGDETPEQLQRRGGLAMAFQDASLLPWRSLRGNIALALTLARRPPNPKRIEQLIGMVGLHGFEDRRPAQLSGGMRQRVAIARCLVSAPELLLLDEPFGAVDELTRRRLNQDLPALWQSHGTTALLVTHSVTEAVLIADRIIVLSPRPGSIVADVDVALSQPRAPGIENDPEFRDIADAVTDALRDTAADLQFAAQ